MTRIIKEEIEALHEELKKSAEADSDNEERISDILKLLEKLNVTVEILETTKIGITMRRIQKAFVNNLFITESSKRLISSWKRTYAEHLSNPPTQSIPKAPKKAKAVGELEHFMATNTYTITFGDQAENHVGMQKIGSLASEGFHSNDLLQAKSWFEEKGIACELISLHDLLPEDRDVEEAFVLVARNGIRAWGDELFSQQVFKEQLELNPDRKAFMYGRVVNKHARYNLCFGSFDQEADYENGKGTIVSFDKVPALQLIRDALPEIIGPKGANLEAEGNYYYDLAKCGIGYHGDSERMKVIALRLGATMDLCYAWFQDSKPISARKVVTLNHGDMYVMSQKATGQDWKKKIIPTLRHAAGCKKFVDLPKTKKSK